MDEAGEFVPVFETGRVYEWDTAKALLERSGIPSFGQTRSATGLIEAFEHPAPGPGVSFALLVPPDRAVQAQALIREAGLTPASAPGFWHFNSSSRARRVWRILAAVVLLATAAVVVRELLHAVSG